MTIQRPPTILLIEDASSPDERLTETLQRAGFRTVTSDPGADIAAEVDRERPDLLLLSGVGACKAVCEHLNSEDADAWPNALVLTEKSEAAGPDDSRVDYIDAGAGDDALIARIRWHLRLRRLEAEKERLREETENLRMHASIGAVADSVTHNLNNVLGIIFGYMHLLKMNHEKPEIVLKHHASLEQAVGKITEMVRRFGEAAREAQPEPEPVDVGDLLRHAVERFRRENDIGPEYSFTVEPRDLKVNTCFSRAEHTLAGLLENAWESYGEAPASERPIEITACADAENVIIRIRDHGTGIDPEIESTMFEPFTSTKASEGLGLALARRCFRNMGGDLFLKNHPQGGAEAEVRHPL